MGAIGPAGMQDSRIWMASVCYRPINLAMDR